MNTDTKKQSCKYCQINLVNVQELATLTKSLEFDKKPPETAVMKCPVCGYSELDESVEKEAYVGLVSIKEKQISAV